MISIAVSTGRNLAPFNLEKEVCLEFNLPPFHILSEKFVPDIAKEWRERDKGKDFFLKYSKKTGIQFLSSSLENHRKNEENKSFTPPEFFK